MTKPNHAKRIGFLPKCPMSAYKASPPVTHNTTAPKIKNVVPGCSHMNFTA